MLSLRVKESEQTLFRSADPLVRQLPQAVDTCQEGWHSEDLYQEETSAVLLHEWPVHCLVLAQEGVLQHLIDPVQDGTRQLEQCDQ